MLTMIFAALAIVGGFIALFLSVPRTTTPEYFALIAIAAFAFAGALGIWRGVGVLEEYVDERTKPKE